MFITYGYFWQQESMFYADFSMFLEYQERKFYFILIDRSKQVTVLIDQSKQRSILRNFFETDAEV